MFRDQSCRFCEGGQLALVMSVKNAANRPQRGAAAKAKAVFYVSDGSDEVDESSSVDVAGEMGDEGSEDSAEDFEPPKKKSQNSQKSSPKPTKSAGSRHLTSRRFLSLSRSQRSPLFFDLNNYQTNIHLRKGRKVERNQLRRRQSESVLKMVRMSMSATVLFCETSLSLDGLIS